MVFVKSTWFYDYIIYLYAHKEVTQRENMYVRATN